MSDELRQRFERLIPELERRAGELVAAIPKRTFEPGAPPTPAELVEATWQVVCGRRRGSDTQLRAAAFRELECSTSNLALRRMFAAGDLDGAFTYLVPFLESWAANLSRKLAEPRPDPRELVQDAFVKLRRSKMFAAADNPLGYAFRAVNNLVIDHARRRRPSVEFKDLHGGTTEQETSPERFDEILTRAGLDALEKCMLTRVVIDKLAVGKAQKECGGPPGAPYYVLEKILDKIAVSLGIARSRP